MGTSKLPLIMARTASTIFFDDLRIENTGKLLVVGMYPDILTVASYPTEVVVRFMTTIVTPVDRPFKKLILRAYHNNQEILNDAVPEPELNKSDPHGLPVGIDADSNDALPIYFVRGLFVTPAFIVDAPGNLRIRVETESEIIPAGALATQAV